MKLKEGFLALAVAAALSAPAFAQQDPAQSSTDSTMSGSSDPSQQAAESPTSTSDSGAASSSAEPSSMQQADASTSMSSGQPSESSLSSSSATAQSDVPPPIDQNTIRSVQQALNDQGQQLQVDGIWGEKTHQALMQFQRDKELPASGQLDAETFAALDLEDQQQTASSQ